jgi:uncharacterized protein YutE (UPF0331/DUF86 family)
LPDNDLLGENGALDIALANRLSRAVGFRNISVHEYQKIDWHRVYTIVTTHLDDFRTGASALSAAWNQTR